jgi:hypothetical protein
MKCLNSNTGTKAAVFNRLQNLKYSGTISFNTYIYKYASFPSSSENLHTVYVSVPNFPGDFYTMYEKAPNFSGDFYTMYEKAPNFSGDFHTLYEKVPNFSGDFHTIYAVLSVKSLNKNSIN